MPAGYARVSTMDRNPALRTDAPLAAGGGRIFTERASGARQGRPQPEAALDFLREGDTPVVWKLSRLARSLTQVIRTAADINGCGIAPRVLTRNIDTGTPEGRLSFHMTAAFDGFQREPIVENTRAGLGAAGRGHAQGHREPPFRERRQRPARDRPHGLPQVLSARKHQAAGERARWLTVAAPVRTGNEEFRGDPGTHRPDREPAGWRRSSSAAESCGTFGTFVGINSYLVTKSNKRLIFDATFPGRVGIICVAMGVQVEN